jgi:hypothetical protein
VLCRECQGRRHRVLALNEIRPTDRELVMAPMLSASSIRWLKARSSFLTAGPTQAIDATSTKVERHANQIAQVSVRSEPVRQHKRGSLVASRLYRNRGYD